MATTGTTRLVRQAPFSERLKAYLNPFDFLLWISEELNSGEWEDILDRWSVVWGIGVNLVFVVARGGSGSSGRSGMDDVFGDGGGWTSGWGVWMASFVAHSLAMLSILNAAYTFNRKRRYRLFESALSTKPTTSHSLHRVRVDSSPAASSPLKFLTEMLPTTSSSSEDTDTPEPNSTQDEVWELAVWDPTKLSLRLFTLLSPGHVLVYWLYLPLAPLDSRPSVTIATALLLAALMSLQLTLLTANFSQQSKDSTLIHKEVQHEYDAKFVHPSLNKPVRDVGTQCTSGLPKGYTPSSIREVLTYTPTTYVNRGFKVQPSPHYAAHLPQDEIDDNISNTERAALVRSTSTPLSSTNIFSPPSSQSTVYSSPLKPPTPANFLNRQLHNQNRTSNISGMNTNINSRPSTAVSSTGDGGSFGVYSHAYSPLKRGSFIPQQSQLGSSPLKSSPLKDARRPVSPSKVDESPVVRRVRR